MVLSMNRTTELHHLLFFCSISNSLFLKYYNEIKIILFPLDKLVRMRIPWMTFMVIAIVSMVAQQEKKKENIRYGVWCNLTAVLNKSCILESF